MNICLTDDQSEAVERGEAIRVPTVEGKNVLIVNADRWEDEIRDLLEKKAWYELSRKAREQWCRENPYEA